MYGHLSGTVIKKWKMRTSDKDEMIFLALALLLFVSGLIGVLVEGAKEVWLWFLAGGLVLDLTMVLLILTDWHCLRKYKSIDRQGRIAHFLMLLSAGSGFLFRLKAENTIFAFLMGLTLIFWLYSLIRLRKSMLRSV